MLGRTLIDLIAANGLEDEQIVVYVGEETEVESIPAIVSITVNTTDDGDRQGVLLLQE